MEVSGSEVAAENDLARVEFAFAPSGKRALGGGVLAGPNLELRKDLFDFIVAELGRRESDNPRRIRPVRVALQNQRDDLLAFAGVLDDKLATISRAHELPEHLVRAVCVLHRKPSTSPAYWQGWNRLRARMGAQFLKWTRQSRHSAS
ncbi:hypothetical protein [Rugamonas rubra]|uniref:hypothetical protein n=1 Tax=Rugamonas rubra TaxID=758825 RepID=UPI0015819140|nr:hypothetical protein [Rugamonas rubra]